MRELFHSCGDRFDDVDAIKHQVQKVADRWHARLQSAILHLAEQRNATGIPDSDASSNGNLYVSLKRMHDVTTYACI